MILEEEANKRFGQLILEYGRKNGFVFYPDKRDKYNPPYLLRNTNSGFEKISNLHLEFFNKKLFLIGAFGKRIDTIENYWSKYYTIIHKSGKELNLKTLMTIVSNARLVSDYQYDETNKLKYFRIKDRYEASASEDGVNEIFGKVVANIEKYVLPAFEKYDSLLAINQEVNNPPELYLECIHLFMESDLLFKKMIIAKLSGDNNYSAVCDAMKERIMEIKDDDSMQKTYLDVWTNLKNDLDLVIN